LLAAALEGSMFNKKDNDTSNVSEPKSEPVIETATNEEEKPVDPNLAARSVSYIGPGLSLTGEIIAEEGLVIEGEVEGKITSADKNLTVGKKGRVTGDIYGSVVELRGTVEGEIYSDVLVRLYSSAVVEGKIYCKRLVLDEGAEFNGTVDMNWDGKMSEEAPEADSDSEDSVVRVVS
jgi:cytoskeletal protein CcmA (bactofilin family)